jgi:hypothetical protein
MAVILMIFFKSFNEWLVKVFNTQKRGLMNNHLFFNSNNNVNSNTETGETNQIDNNSALPISATTEMYIVTAGDTFSSIATIICGSDKFAAFLAQHNGFLVDSDLSPGEILVVPTPAVVPQANTQVLQYVFQVASSEVDGLSGGNLPQP